MKRLIALIVALLLSCVAMAESGFDGPRGGMGGHNGPRGGMGGSGMNNKTDDYELQTMIAEVAPKFQLLTFTDDTGAELQYQLYVPEGYNEEVRYPLIQFIPDSSVVGQGADAVLTQGWGGLIWATDEEQAKHPSFVVVPVFTETIVDDEGNHNAQIETAVKLIQYLTETYSIDTQRLYTTGQSMGGMTSFYLNVTYPDLFAATLYVGSQWDIDVLSALEDDTFFYIVAAGDPKASAGQAELKALFDTDSVRYSAGEWSAQDDAETQNTAVDALLAEGNHACFVTFTEGSTLADGASNGGPAGEHMTSFDYAYKIEAVRDWLFEQRG